MRGTWIAFLGVVCLVQASADEGLVLTNKDVDSHKAKGKTITVVTPREPSRAHQPESAADWRETDRQRAAENAEREAEERAEELREEQERAEEETGFYKRDEDNPNKRRWVDPEDEDFRSQLKDERRARERRERDDEWKESDGRSDEEDAGNEEDEIAVMNPRTKDVEIIPESDPRYERYLKEGKPVELPAPILD